MSQKAVVLVALSALALAIGCGARTSLELGASGGGGGELPSKTCGNALVDAGEECDDGNHDDADACLSTCKKARCGDGIQSVHEACDDGNTIDTDACRNDCSLSTCGDGIVQSPEQCDSKDPNQCTPLCLVPSCGDGFVAPASEACDRGPSNENRPAIELVADGATSSVVPIRGNSGIVAFYDYQSASSHTGVEKLHTSNLFLYQQSAAQGLSLFTIHGIDLDSSGQSEGEGRVDQTFTGLPSQVFVALSDDKATEFHLGGAGQAIGHWTFNDNTDGGVLGGIPFPGAWTIEIDSSFIQSITAFRYDDPKIGPIAISGTTAVLRALDTPSLCRTDCTVPRCGDGVLDGGEVCDDGNVVSGDGCSADCSTTN